MKMTISFTEEEIGWLNWVITDVLKNSELAAHPAAKKILDAQTLLHDVTDALENAGKEIPETEKETSRPSAKNAADQKLG